MQNKKINILTERNKTDKIRHSRGRGRICFPLQLLFWSEKTDFQVVIVPRKKPFHCMELMVFVMISKGGGEDEGASQQGS